MEDYNILITGGTGSLGSQLVKKYSKRNHVVALSRDPHKQTALRAEVSNVDFILGDICDYDKVYSVLIENQIDLVIHTAALKQVDVGEDQVREFVRVNINGADTVARACRGVVGKVLFISSDKAVDPVNLYGKTKAVGEDIYRAHDFSVLRYGNVVDSRGSFIHIWKRLMESNNKILVRRPYPTRFFLRMEDAINLIDNVLHFFVLCNDNGIFVPRDLESFDLEDFIKMMYATDILAWDQVVYGDLLPGEKQHEVLLSEHEDGIEVSDLLCRVNKGYFGNLDRRMYCSKTAPRMTLEGELIRDLFE